MLKILIINLFSFVYESFLGWYQLDWRRFFENHDAIFGMYFDENEFQFSNYFYFHKASM